MQKKILFAISAIVLIAIIFGGFLIFKKRNFPTSKNQPSQTEQKGASPTPNDSSNPNPSNDNQDTDSTEDSDINSNDTEEISDADENNSADETTNSNESFLEVTTKDCDNQCKSYTDPEDLKYCQNICGLATPSKESVSKTTKCETIEDGLEADYCFKSQAINKKDIKLCNSIIDSNIKKSCTNRFLEDILDQVPQE